MHDKENIFVSLVESTLNICWLSLGEHFFPYLVHYTQNTSLVDIRVIS